MIIIQEFERNEDNGQLTAEAICVEGEEGDIVIEELPDHLGSVEGVFLDDSNSNANESGGGV